MGWDTWLHISAFDTSIEYKICAPFIIYSDHVVFHTKDEILNFLIRNMVIYRSNKHVDFP